MSELAIGGWMVRATAQVMNDGIAVERWFAVGEVAEHDAEMAVQRHPGMSDFTVDARRLLAHNEIGQLKLKPGEVRAWSWTPPPALKLVETPKSLREQAARWMQLASYSSDEKEASRMRAFAADYVERAVALEHAALFSALASGETRPVQQEQQQQPEGDAPDQSGKPE